jgi:hypothetical protein
LLATSDGQQTPCAGNASQSLPDPAQAAALGGMKIPAGNFLLQNSLFASLHVFQLTLPPSALFQQIRCLAMLSY